MEILLNNKRGLPQPHPKQCTLYTRVTDLVHLPPPPIFQSLPDPTKCLIFPLQPLPIIFF